MKIWILLISTVVITFITRMHAQNLASSGNDFVNTCSEIQDKPKAQFVELDFLHAGACDAFIIGIHEGIGLAMAVAKNGQGSIEDLGICMPETVTTEQVDRIVLKYIKENPEQAHQRAAILVVKSLQKAFPCAKSVPK